MEYEVFGPDRKRIRGLVIEAEEVEDAQGILWKMIQLCVVPPLSYVEEIQSIP